MSRFPIAEMIRHGRRVECPTWWPKEDEVASRLNWPELLVGCALFDITVASDLYWLGKKDYYSLKEDFGPLSPPFPAMWMEWTIPPGAQLTGAGQPVFDAGDFIGTQNAAFMYTEQFNPYMSPELPIPIDRGVTALCGYLLTHFPSDGRIITVPIMNVIALDRQTGRYVPDSHVATGHRQTIDRLQRKLGEKDFKAATNTDFNPVFLALNLLNCRNVEARERGPAFARSGTEKRRGVPGVRYHTIMLPGMSSAPARTRGARNREAVVMASHRVRGHFKTYTAEAPLMGKHVGTYWWGWNVRGSKGSGEIVADYKFKAGSDAR